MFNYMNPPVENIASLGIGNAEISANTVSKMVDVIKQSSHNPYVRKWAEDIIQDVPDRNFWGEIEAVYNFVQDNTRYVYDPKGLEYFQTPPYVLQRIALNEKPSLDCDDYTLLTLSLLRSIGYNTKIRIASYEPNKKFTHVYGLVLITKPYEWVVLDAVRKDKYLGWEASDATNIKDFIV